MIAVTRGPYWTGAVTPCGAAPALAPTRDELVFGHPHLYRRQVEHLPAFQAHLGRVGQVRATTGAGARLVP
jgi:hypothetical protein